MDLDPMSTDDMFAKLTRHLLDQDEILRNIERTVVRKLDLIMENLTVQSAAKKQLLVSMDAMMELLSRTKIEPKEE
jgi:hypothetical protein